MTGHKGFQGSLGLGKREPPAGCEALVEYKVVEQSSPEPET